MAKGQKKSNKEIKKPKQKKVATAAPAGFEKATFGGGDAAKKKG